MFDLKKCTICPRNCGVDRTNSVGYCGAEESISVAHIMQHHWEEPCISGPVSQNDSPLAPGSGAIFFNHCPLGCIYCQNTKISRRHTAGTQMSPSQLAQEMLLLQDQGAYNINFVSPTHYTPQLMDAVSIARTCSNTRRLTLPVIWNTGGYELPATIEALRGTVDIFLTDFKYSSSELAKKYSSAEDYPLFAATSLEKMLDIVGECTFDARGMLQKGVIVRHLVLPGHRDDSIAVLQKIADTLDISKIRLSLMAQYTPDFLPPKNINDPYASIRRKVTTYEYEKVANEAMRLGFEGYMQERSSATKNFTPDF